MPDVKATVATASDAPKPRKRQRRQHVYVARVNHISTALKYGLFFFNLIFWFLSLAAVGIGTYLFVNQDITVILFIIAILILVIGVITFLVSFFGCIGALRDNIMLLKIYLGFLILTLVALGAIGIFLILMYYIDEVRATVIPERTMQNAIRDYMDDEALRSLIDTIQTDLKCCGVTEEEGYKDWGQYNVYYNCSPKNQSPKSCGVPKSCCKISSDKIDNIACGNDIQREKNKDEVMVVINTKGCIKPLLDWLKDNTTIIGVVILVLMAVQILACFLAYFYINQIKRQIAQWKYD